ncbi:MAG: 2-oxoglutarate dehydrogenase complex dihydrolipoyllysine-residue succinyltransferase [Myxococcota bacterium]
MSIMIKVPSLGESVSEVGIARWLVKEGDVVKRDQELCELESDKTNVMLPAPEGGKILKLLKKAGDSASIGDAIVELEAGVLAAGAGAPAVASAPVVAAPSAPVAAAPAAGGDEKPLSPAVRRLVEESGVNPAQVAGTGPNGRILKGDVLDHLEKGAAPVAAPAPVVASAPAPVVASAPVVPASSAPAGADGRVERVRMSRMRKLIAERLVHAQSSAAILTTFNEVDMGAVMELRKTYADTFQKRHGVKLGFMSFFVKAVIEALKEYPGLNAEIQGDEVLYKHYFDIGVAVGGGKGLVVPVLRDCDHLSFGEIEKTINELGVKAKDGKLTVEELTGGTFTISNGGVYGSLMSTPILNFPQTGILGMHAIKNRPIEYPAGSGQLALRPMMYLALSYDHRIVDGREAVSFLVRVKELIERPERLLLEV